MHILELKQLNLLCRNDGSITDRKMVVIKRKKREKEKRII